MKYNTYQRNHVILPNREQELDDFLDQELDGKKHKWNHRSNSNSEDALTWSCFEVLKSLPFDKKIAALDETMENAYDGHPPFSFADEGLTDGQLEIFIGKEYAGATCGETTELDASIELPGKLIFIEAKLYSSMSVASDEKPHNQIARKLRVGLDSPLPDKREFFFIFLDIAPVDKMYQHRKKEEAEQLGGGFNDKWKSAWWFKYYKHGRNNSWSPLEKALEGIEGIPPIKSIAANMGWLTWSDLYKNILRGAFC